VCYLHSSVASNIVLTVLHCHGHPAILRVSTVCIGCTRICNHHATRHLARASQSARCKFLAIAIPHGGPLYKASAGVRAEVGFSHSNEAHIYPTSVCASTAHHRHSVRVATFHHTLINRSSAWHIQCMMMHDMDVI
jgi:hypothetical protein